MLARTARRLTLRPAATWLLTGPTGLLRVLTGPAEPLPGGTALLRGLRSETAGLLCMLTGSARLLLHRDPLRRLHLLHLLRLGLRSTGRLRRHVRRAARLMSRLRAGRARPLLLRLGRPAGGCLRGCTGGWCLVGAKRRWRWGSGRRRLSEQRVRSSTAQSVRLTTGQRVRLITMERTRLTTCERSRRTPERIRRTAPRRVRRSIRATRRLRWGCAVPGRERGFVLSQR
ncbi:hypothetical protein BWI15_25155 [Kribbella sp. ALI-6-A]|nr:hypothetical protein BWI15_25155 [Kribbella sp. ALI-6-A]